MLDDEIREDYARLCAITKECRKGLASVPEGFLRINMTASGPRYYHRESAADSAGRYLKKNEKSVAVRLAQKDYDEKTLKAAEKELCALKRLAKCRGVDLENPRVVPESAVLQAYTKMHEARRELVTPYDVPDKEYARAWQAEEYTPKAFAFGESAYYTDRGEHVRSKSEILIANKLASMGVPYHYEKPLWLGGCNPIHPDFTVLNVRTRRVYYWEHAGMMGDADYRKGALRRIAAYANAGIFPGDGLILTFESDDLTLDTRLVDQTITHYLL